MSNACAAEDGSDRAFSHHDITPSTSVRCCARFCEFLQEGRLKNTHRQSTEQDLSSTKMSDVCAVHCSF